MRTTQAEVSGSWGRDIVRRDAGAGVPYLVYEPRPTSLLALLEDTMRWSDRVALVHDGERLTYRELGRRIEAGADQLAERGLLPADRVMLLGANTISWVISFWSILRAGGVVVLGNGWWSPDEVRGAIDLTTPTLVLADERCSAKVASPIACESLGLEERSLNTPLPRTDEDDAAVIQFTSGSTGAPKGAVLSHRALIANQHMLLQVARRLPDQLSVTEPAEVSLQTGPLFHVGGVQAMIRSMLTGGTMIFLRRKFEASEVLELIERHGVTRWGGPPTMLSRVLAHPDMERRDLRSLTHISLGGAPTTVELAAKIQDRFPSAARGVSQIYGMSEAGGTLCAASGKASAERPGVTGFPLPLVELRIDCAGPDGVGEVIVRSPTAMSGYWGEKTEATNSEVDAGEGWLRTGDLGRLDVDGYLYVTGRSKDVIIRGGENIAAAHVEAVLQSHADVQEVAVVGLPDDDLGEIVGARVRLREGSSAAPEELRNYLTGKLAYFEVPERWHLSFEALPVNATGKLDKKVIIAEWADRLPTS